MEKQKKVPREDRRIQKTKKLLIEALGELIIEKGYEAITIQDIVDRANVGRSTFYAHYESKDQLMLGNIKFQRELIDTPGDDAPNYPMGINLSYLFRHTREHLNVVNAMLDTPAWDLFANHFTEVIAAKIIAGHERQGTGNGDHLRYRAEAAAGGIMRMLFRWLKDGAVVPAADMIALSEHLLAACAPARE